MKNSVCEFVYLMAKDQVLMADLKTFNWKKIAVILVVLFVLGLIAPAEPIDPWHILSPKKIIDLILALTFIQAISLVLVGLLGPGIGSILTGFLGGLVSSTATTAALARKSLLSDDAKSTTQTLTFLSASFAMLFEALAITIYGAKEIHWNLLLIFSGPIMMIVLMIIYLSRNSVLSSPTINENQLDILPILKLTGFILGILIVSKLLQTFFGQAGLIGLTFIVSLFEIHGSVIANLQLHDFGTISLQFLGGLLATSVFAAIVSKLFLVVTLGSRSLKKSVISLTVILLISLLVSWLIFNFSFSQ